MTSREAEALTERLKKIWGPEDIVEVSKGELFRFHALLQERLTLVVIMDGPHVLCTLSSNQGRSYLSIDANCNLVIPHMVFPDDVRTQGQQQFTSQWLPFFRSGCWLSGCDIEATAHEKAEWIEAFTREELEAWNLKC